MSDVQLLLPNAYISHKYKFMMKHQDFETLILFETGKEIKGFLKRFNYDVEETSMHSITMVDEWYRSQLNRLNVQFSGYDCDYLLDVLWLETRIFEHKKDGQTNYDVDLSILQAYAKLTDHSSAAIKNFARVKMDQILTMRYLRTGNCEESFLQYAQGNMNKADFERLMREKEQSLPTVLEQVYGGWFQDSLDYFFNHKKIFWIDKAFGSLLTQQMSQYRFQTIGEDGLFAYAYVHCEELKNIRMIMKSRLYYLDKEVQLKMVRNSYV